MNVFQWDLHYAPAYDSPGFRTVPTDDLPDTRRRTDDSARQRTAWCCSMARNDLQAPLKVQLDPRVHPAAGDLEARFALEMQTPRHRSTGSTGRSPRRRTLAAKCPAAQRERKSMPKSRTSCMLDVHSSEADVVHPTKIREQLAFLMNSLEGAYARPTAAEYAAAKDLEALATAGEASLQNLTSQ